MRSSIPLTAAAGPASFMSSESPKRRSSTEVSNALGGLPAASTSKNRLTRGSNGTRRSEGQRGLCHRRPLLQIQAVIGEHGHRQPVDSKGHATGVRQLALVVMDAPHLAEVLTVIVEAHARRGGSTRIVGDQQLEFQGLLPLA